VNLVNAVLPELEFPPFDPAAVTECLARAFAGLTLVKEAQATHLAGRIPQAFGQGADQLAGRTRADNHSLARLEGR
jgi:hypothetical protein